MSVSPRMRTSQRPGPLAIEAIVGSRQHTFMSSKRSFHVDRLAGIDGIVGKSGRHSMKNGGWKESEPSPWKNAALMLLFLACCGPGCGVAVAVASGADAKTGAVSGLIFIGVVSIFALPQLLHRGLRR